MAADPTIDPRLRLTVEQYELMGRTGVLAGYDRTELLDGEIYVMSPIGPRHAGTVDNIVHSLILATQRRVWIRAQNPLRLPPGSEPEPDVLVARSRRDHYTSSHPTAADTFLVIEVTDSTLHTDRAVKLPIYAAQGIVEVWIVDLAGRRVLVHTDPVDGEYLTVRELGPGDLLEPVAVPDVKLSVDEILGEEPA